MKQCVGNDFIIDDIIARINAIPDYQNTVFLRSTDGLCECMHGNVLQNIKHCPVCNSIDNNNFMNHWENLSIKDLFFVCSSISDIKQNVTNGKFLIFTRLSIVILCVKPYQFCIKFFISF